MRRCNAPEQPVASLRLLLLSYFSVMLTYCAQEGVRWQCINVKSAITYGMINTLMIMINDYAI